MREQEAVVLENFPDRFYNSPHLQSALTTKLNLKENAVGGGGGGGGGDSHPEPHWDDGVREIEERLRRLKESHNPTKTVDSETHLKERLAKLRDEEPAKSGNTGNTSGEPLPSTDINQPPPSGGLPQPRNKTEAEEATDLVDQMSERVKLDARTDHSSQPLEDSVSKFLSGIEVQLDSKDPDKLLEDLRVLQSRQEKATLGDATSNDVQDIVAKAKELSVGEREAGNTDNIITPYPQFPDKAGEEDEVSQLEISKVLEAAQKELEQREREQRDTDQFLSEASKQLAELRSKESSGAGTDGEVRSKLELREGPKPRLDFSWGHFGGLPPRSAANLEHSGESGDTTAARQLGITLSDEHVLDGGGGSRDCGDEVRGLVERTMAEAALDRRLEKEGLSHYLDKESSKSEKGGGATASGSSGACAASKYSPPEWGVDSDDLPWCCICNADAQIRCYDCDSDLYCTQCFSEGHEQFGLFDHKYAPFEPLTSRAV